MRVLFVEDDPLVGDAVQSVLEADGYAVDWLRLGSDAQAAAQQVDYPLAILDIGLPDCSGLELLRDLKQINPHLMTLLLTARDAVADRVAGLDSGADDYLVKPFEFSELLARLRALRRRAAPLSAPLLTHGELAYDPARREVRRRGALVEIARRELMLLELFLENRGKVMSRESIHGHLYGWNDDVHSNTVEVYVHNLRRLFGTGLIRTIRGIGYVMDAPDE